MNVLSEKVTFKPPRMIINLTFKKLMRRLFHIEETASEKHLKQ